MQKQILASRFAVFADSNKSIALNCVMLSLLFLSCLNIGWKLRSQFDIAIMTIFLSTTGLLFAYSQVSFVRETFSVTKMKQTFADWLGIFDYLHCRMGFGNTVCDRFERPWIYGDGFRILSFINNERLFVSIGVFLFVICIHLAVLAIKDYLSIPQYILIGISPSFLFESDRLNVNLFLFALYFLSFKKFKKLNKYQEYLFFVLRIFLNAFKPLFFVYGILRKETITKLIVHGILSTTVILISFQSLKNLTFARNYINYDQHSQFGSQYIGQVFLGSRDSSVLAIFGIFIVIISAFGLQHFFKKEIEFIKGISNELGSNFGLISSSAILYLILYFSGSQVIYGALAGLIFSSYIISHQFKFSTNQRILTIIAFSASLQIGFSIYRVFSAYILATFCTLFIINNLKTQEFSEPIKQISN